MKRLIPLLILGLVWCGASLSFAQESPEHELEFVRKLREKGWIDLAKAKIEALSRSKNKVLLAELPLETARISISLARQQNPDQRLALFTAARGQLQEFINKNPRKAQAALARAELARLTIYHGQALLSRALREEDNRQRHEKARPAEEKFIEAGKELVAAEKALGLALQDTADPVLKNTLQQELQQIGLDKATNIFNQARTHIDRSKDAVNARRSEIIADAKKAFELLQISKNGQLAKAWLMKCYMEMDNPDKVDETYKAILKSREDRNAGVRLAIYFNMQDETLPREGELEAIGRNPKFAKMKPVDRLRLVQKDGEYWLKTFPAFKNSYEGQGVLYELAMAYYTEGQIEKDKLDKDKVSTAAAKEKVKQIFGKATRHFDELAAMDGDLSERARSTSMSLKYHLLGSKMELNTFDDYLMNAMLERAKVRELNGKIEQTKAGEQSDLARERKKHLRDVIKSLDRALALATSKTPVQKTDEALLMLSGAYQANNDPYRAAIAYESLGRTRPPTRSSPEAAALAIQTYSALQQRQPGNLAIRKRLEGLASYVLAEENQRTWGGDAVTSLAHYHLAMMAQREDNPQQAIKHLEKLPAKFMDYNYTQGQLVNICLRARDKSADPKEKLAYVQTAKAAIGRMNKLDFKEDSAAVIVMTFAARLEMAKFLYAEAIENLNAKKEAETVKKCREMNKFVKDLQGQFDQIPKGKLNAENQEQLHFSMEVMLKYADLGIAEAKFRGTAKDRFDEVIAATNPVVNGVLARAAKVPAGEPIPMKDYRVTGDILGLALRANVQKGDVVRGKAILAALQRISGPDGPASSGNVVALLLNDIASQVRTMTQTKDPVLNTTKKNYLDFLDAIAAEYESRGFDNAAAVMIGHAFVSLDVPAKAVQAFSKVKAPVTLDKKVDKKLKKETDEEVKARQQWEEEVRSYWGVQIEYVRALRACKDKDSYKAAEKILDGLLKHPNARYQMQAMIERNLILEDQTRYREAYIEWSQKFLKNPYLLKDLGNKDVQKVYYTGYFYQTRTCYKMALYDKGLKDPQKFVTGAATLITKLEFAAPPREGWEIAGPLYEELLRSEPRLKMEYDRLKAARPKDK